MNFLLDSNVCIRLLRSGGRAGQASPVAERIRARLDVLAAGGDECFVCSIVRFELLLGAARSERPVENNARSVRLLGAFRSLPFDDRAAEHAAESGRALQAAGTVIGPNDLFIAAIAMAHNATLVTHNVGEFSRVAGLKIEDWEA